MGTLSYIPGYYIESNYIHTTNKMPKGSGLTKPLNLSDELGDLIGAKKGEKLSRPEVSRGCGPTSRRRNCRTPRTSSTSSPTKRWSPSSARKDQSLRHGQVPQDPPDFIDDDATPGIISILALRPLSLSLSISATLSLKVKTNPSCAGVLFE